MSASGTGGGRRWLNPADPKWRAHVDAVLSGELRFGTRSGLVPEPTWPDLPDRKKRMTVICNHGVARGPAKDIGGLTRDRLYASEGRGSFVREGHTARMPCATCRRTWLVPHAELLKLARSRGHRPGRTPVDRVPGVSLESSPGSE